MFNLFLILHNIRSRFNVGAIFRTADAVGIKKIYLCGITPVPPHSKIDKIALGAEKYVPYEYHKQTVRLLKKLKTQDVQLIALEQSKKSIPYYDYSLILKKQTFHYNKTKTKLDMDLKPSLALALILGNEVKGLPNKILNLADKVIEIPMFGKKESLNVAVATGIVVFDLIKSIPQCVSTTNTFKGTEDWK